MKDIVQSVKQDGSDMFIMMNEKNKKEALAQMGKATLEYVNSRGFTQNTHPLDIIANTRFKNILPNVSIRDEFSNWDYDWFRPSEMQPEHYRRIISACMHAYEHNPIANNVVNLMSDFGSRGIRLACPIKKYEKIYKYWFNNVVNGSERSERFLNLLYSGGQVPVQRTTAKLRPRDVKKMQMMRASADIEGMPTQQSLERREIPVKYDYICPTLLEPLGTDQTFSIGKTQYGLLISDAMRKILLNPKTPTEVEMSLRYPRSVLENLKKVNLYYCLPIDNSKFDMYFFKKNDWQVFARPMLSCILKDIRMFEKMQLADNSALDGAISHIRVWLMGDLERGIVPGTGQMSAFNDMLMNQTPGGATDIIWNPALKLIETNSNLHQFLGGDKYQICLSNIFAGLGVPPSLTGSGGEGGMTNNFVSMKTLVERLQYGRDVLNMFWRNEIRLFQEAMGIPLPAEIIYDFMSLSDESAEKALWLDLVDRDYMSTETLQERFDLVPSIEAARIKAETKKRADGKIPPKTSPYHDSQPDLSLKKAALGQGVVTPGEVGIDLDERRPGEKTSQEIQVEMNKTKVKAAKPKGTPGQGRPTNSKDKRKRKLKVVKPRSKMKASEINPMQLMADVQDRTRMAVEIASIVKPAYLNMLTTSLLSSDQTLDFEKIVFQVLCDHPAGDVTKDSVKEIMSTVKDRSEIDELFSEKIQPTVYSGGDDSVIRQLQALVYSLSTGEFTTEEEE